MKNPMAIICAVAALLVAAPARAQPVVTEFPAGAEPLTAETLQAALAGRKLAMVYSSMMTVRMDFKSSDGWVFVTAGNASDSGRWRTEGSQMCIQFQRGFPSGCNEVRGLNGELYLKRDSGQVVRMEPQ